MHCSVFRIIIIVIQSLRPVYYSLVIEFDALFLLITLQDDLWGSAMFLKEANSISVELKKKVTIDTYTVTYCTVYYH